VRRERFRIATSVCFATSGLVVALGLRPISTERILAAYVLVLAGIALAALTRVTRGAAERPAPSPFEEALRTRPARPMRPPELVRTERELTLGTTNAGHLHLRLLPLLRETAAARLAAGHGIDLERRPEAARLALGEEAWELLRPDRPAPADRDGPGVPLKRVSAVIDTLERL
jgi:hypothetical protein